MQMFSEFKEFQLHIDGIGGTAYKLIFNSGLIMLNDIVFISKTYQFKFSFEGSPIPISEFDLKSKCDKLQNLAMLENLLGYCRNVKYNYDIDIIKELTTKCYYKKENSKLNINR